MRTLNAVDGAHFRALDINSAGQPAGDASPASSTLVPSTLVVATTLSLRQSGVRDATMNYYDKENVVVVETERCDTPTTSETEDTQQPRSPVKLSIQPQSRQLSSTKNFPLGPAAAPSNSAAKGTKIINSTMLTSTRVKKQPSRSSSPVKTPGSRPSSRPSSPLKRTPAPGKNERFEATPTGFRYTIELPESKIVPKKDSAATPSKSKTWTPVKKLGFADAPSKQNSPKRANSPAKSASPPKELLKTRATSPEKDGSVNGVNGAEPTPADATPRSHKKRNSLKLTKTNSVHAGMATVEVTKEDVWTGLLLKSLLTSEVGGVESQVKEKDPHDGERVTSVEALSHSSASLEYQEGLNVNGTQATAVPRKQSTSMVPTNFGEMLRNSSQTALQKRSSLYEEAPEKRFASPTVLDKARRNSEMHVQSLDGVIAKPSFMFRSLTTDAIVPVTKDFVNRAVSEKDKGSSEPSPTESRKNGTHRRVSFAGTPRTPTGTPPAIMAAIEADMNDIRSTLRRSLGDGYTSAPVSPDMTRWLGSRTKGRSPPDLPFATDATNIDSTPRRNLNERMAAVKNSIKPSTRSKKAAPAPLTLRPKNKAGPRSPIHSRLPRPSPTKPKTPLRTPGTIPQAPRISPFDVRSPSRVPAMASHRARYARASEKKGETVGFASAEDIAKQVEDWNSTSAEKKPSMQTNAKVITKTTVKTTQERSKSRMGFMRPTATSAKKEKGKLEQNKEDKETYTPPGSPSASRSPQTTHLLPWKRKDVPAQSTKKPSSPLKNPKVRALASAAPRTPLPRGKGSMKALDRGAVRTPSKEMVSKLDKEIDAHLENEARAGRVFTPSGQRISDLLAKRRVSEGL